MEASQILQSSYLDILFDGRNKDYGSYELRKKYNGRISTALLITGAIAIAFIIATFFSKAFALNAHFTDEKPDVIIQEFIDKPLPKVEPPPQKVDIIQPATDKFTKFIIKPNDEVKESEVPVVDDIQKVSDITKEGLPEDNTIKMTPTVDNYSGVVIGLEKKDDPNEIMDKVEIEASTNINQWRRHLENYLQPYIESAASSGMEPGKYTVQVKFLVEKDGSIKDVHALNDPGYGLAKGAEDVLKKGPAWIPGEQNGRKVRSYRTQPITFIISE